MSRKNRPLDGAGPWKFDLPALAPGESWNADFRNRSKNGTKGWFKRYMPFDYGQVTNLDSGALISVEYNGVYDDFVVPNAVESYDRQGIANVVITNEDGAATIAAGDIILAVGVDAYGADDSARNRAASGPLGDVVHRLTGLSFNG